MHHEGCVLCMGRNTCDYQAGDTWRILMKGCMMNVLGLVFVCLCGSALQDKTYLLRGFSVGVPNTFAGGTNLGKAIVIR